MTKHKLAAVLYWKF